MHMQRVRRHGDPEPVIHEIVRRVRLRESNLANVTERKRTTYKKKLGRHEHRVVAEAMIGRKLLPNEVVHHIDHDRHNNDPTNLQVMDRVEHLRLHQLERQQ